jgi:hypothetical protein
MPPKRRRTRAPPIIETSERAEQVQVQSGNTAQSGSATNPNTQVSPSSVEGSSTGSSFVDLGAGGSFSPQGTADLPPDEPPSDPSDPESSDSSSPPSHLSDSEPEFEEEETTIMSVSFGSMAIEVQDTPMAVSDRQPLYTKEDRAKLAADKLLDLHKQATAKAHDPYRALPMDFHDPDKLTDTYDLAVKMYKSESHFIKFDMADVFNNIVVPNYDPTAAASDSRSKPYAVEDRTYDLFKDFGSLTIKMVGKSNQWWRQYTKEDYYRENLKLTCAVGNSFEYTTLFTREGVREDRVRATQS